MEPVGDGRADGVDGSPAADGARCAGDVSGAAPEVPVDCYVLFRSHTDGLALYSALRGAGVGARIAPTPRAARTTCGMSLLVSCDDEERIRAAARACGAHIEGVARLERQIRPDRDRYC